MMAKVGYFPVGVTRIELAVIGAKSTINTSFFLQISDPPCSVYFVKSPVWYVGMVNWFDAKSTSRVMPECAEGHAQP
jgi:hypothetical protein